MTRSKYRRLRIKANRIARNEAQKWPMWMVYNDYEDNGIGHSVRVPRAKWFANARLQTREVLQQGDAR